MTADLYSFAIPFMADRSSVFPFDSEKRLGSFFLGVSPVGKPQKRKMSQQPFFFFGLFLLPWNWAVVSAFWELGMGSQAGRPLGWRRA